MRIGLLEELERGDFDAALFLTYTLNLRFFEELVLPRLQRMGIGRIGILTDEKGYEDSLSDPLLQQSDCGRSFMLASARLPRDNLQHAKVLWLWSPNLQKVYIGSHNLTMAGYNDQLEVTAQLNSSDSGHRQALRDLYEVISRVIPRTLDPVWRHFTQPEGNPTSPSIWLLSSLDAALGPQLVKAVGQAEELRVVTPFLEAEVLHDLSEGVHARDVILDVPHQGTDTPVARALSLIPDLTIRSAPESTRLHAKAYEFRSGARSWLALGSANCTQAGLGRSVLEGGNLEIMLLSEGSSLSDEVVFSQVTEPERFPFTGRQWDDERASSSGILIHQAEYREGRLVVEWSWRGNGSPRDVLVSTEPDTGSQHVNNVDTPLMLALPTAPRVVAVRGMTDEGLHEARAWVNVPELLDAQVARRRALRWMEPLVSADPVRQADHIAAFFDQVLRDYFRASQGDSPSGDVIGQGTSRTEARGQMRKLVEIFQFSPDPDEVRVAAAQLLSGHGAADPLAILRSLISRLEAEPSPEIEQDPEAYDDYQRRQERGRHLVGDSLVRHIEQLGSRYYDWAGSERADLIYCLRQTFGATALVWHEVVVRDATRGRLSVRLSEAFLALLERLSAEAVISDILRSAPVAGPLVLSLGAVYRAASDDSFLADQLRRAARSLLGDDPRPILRQWKSECPQHAEVLFSYARRSDPSTIWEHAATQLWGVGVPAEMWSILLDLQRADLDGQPDRDQVRALAVERYRTSTDGLTKLVWQKYEGARRGGKLPVAVPVSKPVCPKCFVKLPENKIQQFNHRNAAVCDCGEILIRIV